MRNPAPGVYLSGCCYACYLFALCVAIAALPLFVVAQDATQCASSQLDWYTTVVGETPCRTYERLRQICNADYQVPKFDSKPPGDKCDDQVSGCCCNTIAFALSMLCMNCQQDTKPGDQTGIDAPVETYDTYRGSCGAGVAHSLPGDIQQAVCNLGIKLDDYLYNGWDDGAWFYVWTKENAGVTHAANKNNTFTHCENLAASTSAALSLPGSSSTASMPSAVPSQASSQLVPTPSSNATGSGMASNNHGGSKLSFGASAAIGGVVGVLGVCALAAGGFFLWRRHRRSKGAYTAPSNLARRLSYNPFLDRPLDTPTAVSPYVIPTNTRGQMDGDLKPDPRFR